jgi:hypothetical protein
VNLIIKKISDQINHRDDIIAPRQNIALEGMMTCEKCVANQGLSFPLFDVFLHFIAPWLCTSKVYQDYF